MRVSPQRLCLEEPDEPAQNGARSSPSVRSDPPTSGTPQGIKRPLHAIPTIQPAGERDIPGMSDVKNEGAGGAWTTFEAEAMPHMPRLFRLAMWLERNRSEAEDLVQETLMQALKSFHRFTPGTNCRAWLVTILYHVRSNRIRARSRVVLVPDENHFIAETVPIAPSIPDRLTDEEVLGALRDLPEAHQQLILLCDIEELTYREAAAALSIPIGTVMSRLHRARALLREALAHLADTMVAPAAVATVDRQG